MSDLGNHHLGFFPKGLTCDFGSKFLCVYGQIGPGNDVWGCFRVVVLWSWPYMKISCTLTLGTSYHCGTYDWFPPPLTLLLNSEGITVGLDSATTLWHHLWLLVAWIVLLCLTQVNKAHLMLSWGTSQGLVTSARVLSLARVLKRPTWASFFFLNVFTIFS